MKTKKVIGTIIVLGITIFSLGVVVGAATTPAAEPGSTKDPLVTKSYLEKVLSDYSGGSSNSGGGSSSNNGDTSALEKKITALEKRASDLEILSDTLKTQVDALGTIDSDDKGVYKRILMKKGQTLTGSAGAEFILYTGGANVVTKYSAGVIDMNTSKVASNGVKMIKYHTYLIAGRSSIKTTANSYVYVKGTYTLK